MANLIKDSDIITLNTIITTIGDLIIKANT